MFNLAQSLQTFYDQSSKESLVLVCVCVEKGYLRSDSSEADCCSCLLVYQFSQPSLPLHDAVGHTHLTTEGWQKYNNLKKKAILSINYQVCVIKFVCVVVVEGGGTFEDFFKLLVRSHTSIGSTSCAMTTRVAFFCSMRLVT